MKLKFVCVLALALSSAACAKMQEIERVAPAQAQAAGGIGKTKTFIYEKALVKNPAGASVVTVQVGITCAPRSEGVSRDSEYTEASTMLESAFKEEFEQAGYTVLATATATMFTDKRDLAADYRIGAVVTKPKMNVCLPMIGFGSTSGHGEASMTVEWQVYSPSRQAVVYTSEQKGYAKIDSSIAQPTRALWRQAFGAAVRGLLADPGFQQLVNSPSTPAPASRARTN